MVTKIHVPSSLSGFRLSLIVGYATMLALAEGLFKAPFLCWERGSFLFQLVFGLAVVSLLFLQSGVLFVPWTKGAEGKVG
jgi:hypothetical protein